MGADLIREDATFREWLQLASDCAGTDLRRLCLRGPERELTRTENLQPALVAVSLGCWRRLAEQGIQPAVVLGHSLGEITALAAAGVLSPENAIRVAARRGQLMGAAASQRKGGLLAVLSAERERLLETIKGWSSAPKNADSHLDVFLANDNSPSQLVLSGEWTALKAAAEWLRKAGLGPCKELAVSGPWHSPLMIEAQTAFTEWLHDISFTAPRVPLLMNTSAEVETDPDAIRRLVACNLTEPVQWRRAMQKVAALGLEVLVELGPGRVLSGLARANGVGAETRLVNISCVGNLPRQ